jgi:hypothetical protein
MRGADAEHAELPQHYRDVAVLAYPVTEAPLPLPAAETGAGAAVAVDALLDERLQTTASLPKGEGDEPPTLVYDYGEPVTVRSATLYVPNARPPFGDPVWLPLLEAESEDTWTRLAKLPLTEAATTVSFEPVTARRFRLVLGPNTEANPFGLGEGAPGAIRMSIFPPPSGDAVPLGTWKLDAEPRVNRAAAKAGYATELNYFDLGTGPGHTRKPVLPDDVVDLTSRVGADGRLDWTPPAGSDWRILRLGYSLTGKQNHPATADATGLEVDKYDGAAVRRYLTTYLDRYRETAGADLFGAHGLRGLLTDSIEVDESNWTPDMRAKFEQLRGYDPTPWLPALTGAVIGTPEQSEAFLYDFRRTLADLLASEHYGTVAQVAGEYGLIVYGEALEDRRPVLGDDIAMRRHADIPMAAMWMYNRDALPRPTLLGDMKGAASVAHVYGQNLVAAESMTSAWSPWAFAPADLKRVIDLEFAHGINRPVIHTSVHQPLDDRQPGLSLLIFGQYFNRHETWAEMARPWIDYVARTSFLLQQGRNVADIAFFHGEDSPVTALFAMGPPPELPRRFAYDFVNADVLCTQLDVEDDEFVAKSGVRYQALYLGGTSAHMTLPTLRCLADLVGAGATVIGGKPAATPSLADDADEFADLAGRAWADAGKATSRVVVNDDADAALAGLGVVPGFECGVPCTDGTVLFVQRATEDADIFFVNNRKSETVTLDARFRVTGKRPELWRAIDGSRTSASFRTEGVQTVVPLELGPEDALFVVFREQTRTRSFEAAEPREDLLASVDKVWTVTFQAGRGAPASVQMESLAPLNESDDPGVRYFSGIASYTSSFELPAGRTRDQALWLDLGAVGDVAEVFVNGKTAGITWFPPYRVDVTDLVRRGQNDVEVRVANLWVNRLIGDKQPGAAPITFTAAPTYEPDAPLRPSGLMGPVQLMKQVQK